MGVRRKGEGRGPKINTGSMVRKHFHDGCGSDQEQTRKARVRESRAGARK
jgi:hypothetical protein